MDADVAELVRAERVTEAARLASARGDAKTAAQLFERACDWASASREALRAGDRQRAMELAAESRDAVLCESVAAALEGEPALARTAAARLDARGHHPWAARLLEAAGDAADKRAAAVAWERAGDARRAAELLEGLGDPAAAARVLEAAVRRDATAWPVVVALGALLARFSKYEGAVRALQRVPSEAPERRDALAHLVPALEQLGLTQAATDAAAELAARGGARATADQPPAPAGARPRLFGRYELLEEVASSPSARVLACTDLVMGERVAVKLFAAWESRGRGRDALARFEREVRTMRALDHPNVVPLREFLPEGPAMVLAWMGGGTLERLLAAAGALAPARAAEIAAAVLSALAEAHRRGIVHRDVKPANVLFDDAGGARLGDFGVAHLGDLSTTATAGMFGTMAYMSPEQREGRPAGASTDVFAVGVMLREMLTGERPGVSRAPATTAGPLAAAHPELGAAHDACLARMTATDPADRPDAAEARAAVRALPWPATVEAPRAGPRSERRSSVRPDDERLAPGATPGSWVDAWTGRSIELAPLTEGSLARARAFALAGHPSLQAVLRVDRARGALWLETLTGSADAPRPGFLSTAHRAALGEALDALHEAGGVHGHVDAAHVARDGDRAVLRFAADAAPTATADFDRLALARM
jgi:hypothetical protein